MVLAAFAPAFSMRIRAGMPKVSCACLSKFCICCIESMLCFMGVVVNILVGYLGEGSAPAGIRTQVTGVRGLNDYRTTLQERLVIVFMHENILNSLWLICYVVSCRL